MNGKTLRCVQRLRAETEHSHDNFLPGGIGGYVIDLLFLIWNRLHRVDNFLEHGSLPGRQGNGMVLDHMWH